MDPHWYLLIDSLLYLCWPEVSFSRRAGEKGKVFKIQPVHTMVHVSQRSKLLTVCTTVRVADGRDFPGGPVVKTLPSNAGGAGSIPGLGAKIPHASRPKKPKNIKEKQYCNKFNEDFKNGPCQKK